MSSRAFTVENVGASTFDPTRMSHWVYDERYPLYAAKAGGTCNRNIYNANVVQNGAATWNVYFGGWDGVSSCHDSVSIVVTEDAFATASQPHVPQIATGSMMHVNNPSVIRINQSSWMMVYTELNATTGKNKPGISTSTNGADWTPNVGGEGDAFVRMKDYANWSAADVNGGNVLHIVDSQVSLFFIDFADGARHVFRAVSDDERDFVFRGVALDSTPATRIVNDLKRMHDQHIMGLHNNGDAVFYSLSETSRSEMFAPSAQLFAHRGDDDLHIVSVGFVTDTAQGGNGCPSEADRLLGAVYGAGPNADLAHNSLFAAWLQKRVEFVPTESLAPLSDARAVGPFAVSISWSSNATNASASIMGRFRVYDEGGKTLLFESDAVEVSDGDVWALE